jgi:hypothetical protein
VYVKDHAVIIAESVEGDTHTILRPEASVSHAKELRHLAIVPCLLVALYWLFPDATISSRMTQIWKSDAFTVPVREAFLLKNVREVIIVTIVVTFSELGISKGKEVFSLVL